MFKVVHNPKTGKMETVEYTPSVTPESLAKQRREVRDMIEGNVQFHDDPMAAPKPVEPSEYKPDDDIFSYMGY